MGFLSPQQHSSGPVCMEHKAKVTLKRPCAASVRKPVLHVLPSLVCTNSCTWVIRWQLWRLDLQNWHRGRGHDILLWTQPPSWTVFPQSKPPHHSLTVLTERLRNLSSSKDTYGSFHGPLLTLNWTTFNAGHQWYKRQKMLTKGDTV